MASRYRGVPSMACANCRTRRIKCDRQRPICGQCKRSGRACAGYRDPLTLAFLDQSQDTILKVQSRQNLDTSRSSPRLGSLSRSGRPDTSRSFQSASSGPPYPWIKATIHRSKTAWSAIDPASSNPALSPYLSPHYEDQATCFFFRNFVHSGTAGKSMYWYLPSAYNKNVTSAPLSDTIAAIGLAGLSRISRDPGLAIAGTKKYNAALRSMGDALYSKDADTDETAVTVELLGLYAVTTCDGSPNLRSWVQHMHGAIALLEARNQKQFETELGCHAFLQLYRQIGKLCLQTHRRFPPKMIELAELCRNKFTKDVEFVFSFATVLAEIADLRADINDSSENYALHPLTHRDWVKRSATLSEKLRVWYSTLPSHSLPCTRELDNPNTPSFRSTTFHVYSDIWTASCLSFYRVVSLIVHELILEQLAASNHLPSINALILATQDPHSLLSQEDRSHIAPSKAHMQYLTDEICASVPYMLNYHDHPSPNSSGADDSNSLSVYGGNAILCPLYIAASMPFCSPETWTYIVGRLQLIGTELGVGQALTLVYQLNKMREEESE